MSNTGEIEDRKGVGDFFHNIQRRVYQTIVSVVLNAKKAATLYSITSEGMKNLTKHLNSNYMEPFFMDLNFGWC